MILGQSEGRSGAPASGGRTTLDDIFRRAAQRRPDALAIVDPRDRESVDGTPPRRLTYGEADRLVSAIAGRLRRIGLTTDAIVGFQIGHNIESVLTFLAILRGGMIAAPLPILWRRSDCLAALSRIGAKGLITCARHRDVDHCQIAMQVAAEIFPIRYVCGFGGTLGDGVIPLDDLFTIEKLDPLPAIERDRKSNPAAHLAAITWDLTPDGLVAVARNHMELLAGGLSAFLEGRIAPDAVILSACPVTSFAGLSLSLMPWLFAGGTLVLHEPFDAKILAEQIRTYRPDTMVVPGAIVPRLAEGGLLSAQEGLRTLLAAWRSPERVAGSAPWRDAGVGFIDAMIFGEIALIAARRGADGRPGAISFGPRSSPHGTPNAVQVAEIGHTEANTVAIRGPMVPRFVYPPGAERFGQPVFRMSHDGYVDTGYTCRVDRDGRAMIVTGPPAGLVSVGGYRFDLRDLQTQVGRIENGSTLAGLPDGLTGHRLAGHAGDGPAMRHALAAAGLNPLIIRAFRERSATPAQSS